jgi:hypothetical protein
MLFQHKLAVAFTLGLATAAAHAFPVVYTLGAPGQFGTVNLTTGTFTSIGPGISVGTGGLIQGPGGKLLSLGFNGTLNAINPTTGILSPVGATGLGDCSLPTSPCGSNSANIIGNVGSSIYATDLANNLYTVNPATGVATLLGPTGIPGLSFPPHTPVPGDPDGSFYVYDETLFGYNGGLYANFDDGIFDPVTFTPSPITAPSLYKINTTTGVATLVGPTDFGLEGITAVNGQVYAFNLPFGQIVTLDVQTGNTTYVTDFDPAAGLVGGAAAASPVPDPPSLALFGTGLAAIAAHVSWRRRLRL